MKGGNKLADVSVEALQKVKSALTIFQSDITGISSRATAQAQNCLGLCHGQITEHSKLRDKVNTNHQIEDGILYMCYVDYPVDFFVQSSIVSSLIKEKCASLLVEGSIRLPITLTIQNAPSSVLAPCSHFPPILFLSYYRH